MKHSRCLVSIRNSGSGVSFDNPLPPGYNGGIRARFPAKGLYPFGMLKWGGAE